MSYYCYLIISNNNTYIGVTNNLSNRIKKHNGLIKGGAKSTRICKGWSYHTVLWGFKNKKDVMRFEWYWKHQINKNNKWVSTKPGINHKMSRLLDLLLNDEWNYVSIFTKIDNKI